MDENFHRLAAWVIKIHRATSVGAYTWPKRLNFPFSFSLINVFFYEKYSYIVAKARRIYIFLVNCSFHDFIYNPITVRPVLQLLKFKWKQMSMSMSSVFEYAAFTLKYKI